jgi:hypothetical protein
MTIRKIIQIAVAGETGDSFLILCDDGSLWQTYAALGTWRRIDTSRVTDSPPP